VPGTSLRNHIFPQAMEQSEGSGATDTDMRYDDGCAARLPWRWIGPTGRGMVRSPEVPRGEHLGKRRLGKARETRRQCISAQPLYLVLETAPFYQRSRRSGVL
jgi:hypothetical protein